MKKRSTVTPLELIVMASPNETEAQGRIEAPAAREALEAGETGRDADGDQGRVEV